jgi:rhamnosyltransferase
MGNTVEQRREKVCASIVLYEPDCERLVQNINAIRPQVEQIIIVDNHSQNLEQVGQLLLDIPVVWIENSQNIGIAGALNQILDQADGLGYDWVVTLDQDSVVCEDMVQIQLDAIQNVENVAMVAPYMIDINLQTLEEYKGLELLPYEEVEICITSGTMTNIKAAKALGGFREKLFIDFVDHDMCLRLRQAGYRVIQANRAYILHEIGRMQKIYVFPQLGKWTGIAWFKRPKYLPNHSPMRVFYQSRNLIYMLRKYGSFFMPHPFWYWAKFCRGMGIRFVLEKYRWRKLWMFIKGTFCGAFMRIKE